MYRYSKTENQTKVKVKLGSKVNLFIQYCEVMSSMPTKQARDKVRGGIVHKAGRKYQHD